MDSARSQVNPYGYGPLTVWIHLRSQPTVYIHLQRLSQCAKDRTMARLPVWSHCKAFVSFMTKLQGVWVG